MTTSGLALVRQSRRSASAAGLHYVMDTAPGIRRVRTRSGFRYVTSTGTPVRQRSELARIRALAIPPAWEDVWVCADPSGHLQATGRDARGRKQHRYHSQWRRVRDEAKYDRILEFASALPSLRRRTDADLAATGLPREKVVALIVQLLDKTAIRVGNDEYARDNHSYGLTTLHGQHAKVAGSTIRFRFKGKSGKVHDISFSDARLARIVKRCQELPGRELFQYVDDDGQVHSVGSADVNDYLRAVSGGEFSAKDFRTWTGTVLAAEALRTQPPFESEAEAKSGVVAAVDAVAGALGNTRAVCRKCYIHPAVIDEYLAGTLQQRLASQRAAGATSRGLSKPETAVLGLLQRRLRRDAQKRSA